MPFIFPTKSPELSMRFYPLRLHRISSRNDYNLRIDKSVLEKPEDLDKEKWSLTLDELTNVYVYFGT